MKLTEQKSSMDVFDHSLPDGMLKEISMLKFNQQRFLDEGVVERIQMLQDDSVE
jgi:hypothetical protein